MTDRTVTGVAPTATPPAPGSPGAVAPSIGRSRRSGPRSGNGCKTRRCGADHVRGRRSVPVTNRPRLGSRVRKVCKIAPTGCTAGCSLLPQMLGRQRGTAPRCRGPIVSLNRRDGSNPLRRGRYRPTTVCQAQVSIRTPGGVDLATPDAASCRRAHARFLRALRALWAPGGAICSPALAGLRVLRPHTLVFQCLSVRGKPRYYGTIRRVLRWSSAHSRRNRGARGQRFRHVSCFPSRCHGARLLSNTRRM